MSVSRLILGALAGVVATVPAIAAPAAKGVVAVEASGSDILRLSNAARNQLLERLRRFFANAGDATPEQQRLLAALRVNGGMAGATAIARVGGSFAARGDDVRTGTTPA